MSCLSQIQRVNLYTCALLLSQPGNIYSGNTILIVQSVDIPMCQIAPLLRELFRSKTGNRGIERKNMHAQERDMYKWTEVG